MRGGVIGPARSMEREADGTAPLRAHTRAHTRARAAFSHIWEVGMWRHPHKTTHIHTHLLCTVDIGPLVEQQPDDLEVAELCGHVEGRGPVLRETGWRDPPPATALGGIRPTTLVSTDPGDPVSSRRA